MSKMETKVPVKTEGTVPASASAMQAWRPFESLRHEVDRLFEDFTTNPFRMTFRRPMFDLEPFWQPQSWVAAPAVDLVEHDKAFEMTVDLPGMDEKHVEVKLAGGVLTIKGEKEEAKEDKKEAYHVKERRYGSFERAVRLPEGVDPDKIEAAFKKGVLTVTMPKTPEAQKPVKTIAVKAG